MKKTLLLMTSSLLILSLQGCSAISDNKVEYKSARAISPLELPPDLVTPLKNKAPSSSSATALNTTGAPSSAAIAAIAPSQIGLVRLEQSGNTRFLVVEQAPANIWVQLTEFWKNNGFSLIQNQAELGIIETDWAENRAKLPSGWVGKLFNAISSTGELDKFRLRVEKNSNGSLSLYLSHKGLVEIYANDHKDLTKWIPRASDPELENEFLRRLMVALGASLEQAQKALPSSSTTTPTPPQAQTEKKPS